MGTVDRGDPVCIDRIEDQREVTNGEVRWANQCAPDRVRQHRTSVWCIATLVVVEHLTQRLEVGR